MGCIPSKAIARSMSLREELNHGFQTTSVVWEELLTSHTNNDQLLAYICAKKKLRTSSLTLPSTDPHTPLGTEYFPDSLDAIPEAKSDPEMAGEFNLARFTRSRSCQILGENGIFDSGFENDVGLNGNKLDWKDKSLTGSRSFHTVEEYDALLERIHKSTTDKGSFEDYLEGLKLQQSSTEDQIDGYIQRPAKACPNHEDVEKSDNFENDAKGGGKSETGWKRKERAKGLTTLDVPTIEFPAIGRVKQWTPVGGQVYSPGAYVTPKFGSYNTKITPAIEENRGGENAVFSPELVAAFEDYMQQLQVEEDSILSHMDEIENRVKIPT